MTQNPFQNFMVRYGAGDTVFGVGDPGKTMYIVQSGKVELFQDVDGSRRPLAVMEKGDFFGEMSILEGMPRTMEAEALEDAELIEINNTIFDKMIRGNIEIAIRLLRKLSLRLRDAESELIELRAGNGGGTLTGARPRPEPKPVKAASGARLESEDGSVFPLSAGETRIGRYDPVTEMRPDVDLTDQDLKRTVSRQHAMIVCQENAFSVVEEVGALNGTAVNDSNLVPGKSHVLQDGDAVTIGSVKLRFHV